MKNRYIFLSILVVLFIGLFYYTFNSKIDLNGDNCGYYMAATSLASGHGYSDISNPDFPAINSFPPGYPLIMTPLRMVTDSFIAQKIMNGIFLLLSILLLCWYMEKQQFKDSLVFVVGCLMLLNMRLFHFATMMMSEMSFLFTSVLVLFSLMKIDTDKPCYKNIWFYIMIFSLLMNYHIRTQGLALVAAVIVSFLLRKKWKETVLTVVLFIIGTLPYMIRNKMAGLTQSRYMDTLSVANPWRPEEGSLSLIEVVKRFFDTIGMLIAKALPNSITPFVSVDYDNGKVAGLGLWILGILLITLIVIGFWQFKKQRIVLIAYSVFSFGLIGLFNTPSGNRYITVLLPILTMGLMIGIYHIMSSVILKLRIKSFSPYFLLLLGLFAITPLKELHAENKCPFPPNYQNFFQIGQIIREQLPSSVKIASRKPSLLYMYSRSRVCNFPYEEDKIKFLKGLLNSQADFVILDQLGYSATARYLYPAIEAYPTVFILVGRLENPDTYLFRIYKEQIQKIIGSN